MSPAPISTRDLIRSYRAHKPTRSKKYFDYEVLRLKKLGRSTLAPKLRSRIGADVVHCERDGRLLAAPIDNPEPQGGEG